MDNYTADVYDLEDPTLSELSCIVDHMEIAGDSPKLWTTLSLELEALTNKRQSDKYWQNEFRIVAKNVKEKNKMLQISKNNKTDENLIELTDLELRILKVTEKFTETPTICRICLILSDDMAYIFEEDIGELSTVNKLNYCNCISNLTKDDGFPQYICKNCEILLDNAYQFKILCKKSEESLNNEFVKQDAHLEYFIDSESNFDIMDDEDIDEENIEDEKIDDEEMEKSTVDKILTKINVTQIETIDCGHQDESRIQNKLEILNGRKYKRRETINNDLQCETCGVICKSSGALKLHKMKLHLTLKPHQCTVCGKNFKTRLSLKIHMRSHTGERPYVCETCGKAFKTCSAVNNHRAIHANFKEFKCPHCSYRACTKANLKIHDRTHSGVQPYPCKFCSLKFSTASNMHKHIRNIHQQQKTHKCEQCDRSFFSRESARKHMVTHTGLKPYSCTHCPMSYGWYNGLQKHNKIQHPGLKMPTEKSFFNLLPESI